MNIPIDNEPALLGIVKDRFETSLKQWSSPSVQAVGPSAEGEVEPLDGSAQLGLQGFNLQMVMISHQHKGMNPQAKPLRHALEQLQEMLVCLIVGKQLTAIDSAIEYVVPTVLYGNAQGTTHSGRLSAYPALPVKFDVDC